jgi:hypothetical protein
LTGFKDKKIIKVITGVRRCGKSTLLLMFIDYLLNNGIDEEQIISINFEDINYMDLLDYKKLYEYLLARIDSDRMNYIFLDEIQNVRDFQRVADSLFLKDNVDIYMTGSNAYLLSSEISTFLSGRYVQIEMLPLSFKEYISSFDDKKSLNEMYSDYLLNSSFPMTIQLDSKQQIRDYLDGVYNTVIMKDVLTRNKIADTMMLESVVRFLFDNIGNVLSTKKISDTMNSGGRKIDIRTVESYIKSLMNAFIVYQAKRYDIRGKQYLKTLEKYYVVDIGLRYNLLGFRNIDYSHILENVVYLELIRRGYKVYIGKIDGDEIDFIVEKPKGIEYFQISASVNDETTLERELKPLRKIRDSYPKYILTLDENPGMDIEGIRVKNALKYLIGE